MFPGCCNTSLGHSPQVKGLTSSIKRRLYPVTLSTTPSSSCWPPRRLLPGPEVMCWLGRATYLFLHHQASPTAMGKGLPWAWSSVLCFLLPCLKSWHLPLVFPSQDSCLEASPHPPFSTFFFTISHIKQVSPGLFSLPPCFPSSHRIIKSLSRLSSPYHFKWIEKRSDFLPLCLPDAEFQNERKVLSPSLFVHTAPCITASKPCWFCHWSAMVCKLFALPCLQN